MSPRRTETLHEFGHRQHLRPVVVVAFESGNLGGKSSFVVKPGRSLYECSTDRFRARQAGCFERGQGTESFFVESNRDRFSHAPNVSRPVIRDNSRKWESAPVDADTAHVASRSLWNRIR